MFFSFDDMEDGGFILEEDSNMLKDEPLISNLENENNVDDDENDENSLFENASFFKMVFRKSTSATKRPGRRLPQPRKKTSAISYEELQFKRKKKSTSKSSKNIKNALFPSILKNQEKENSTMMMIDEMKKSFSKEFPNNIPNAMIDKIRKEEIENLKHPKVWLPFDSAEDVWERVGAFRLLTDSSDENSENEQEQINKKKREVELDKELEEKAKTIVKCFQEATEIFKQTLSDVLEPKIEMTSEQYFIEFLGNVDSAANKFEVDWEKLNCLMCGNAFDKEE